MKKFLALSLVLSLALAPTVTLAATFNGQQVGPPGVTNPNGPDVPAGTSNIGQITSLTAAGDVVGCQTGGFGGALAQTFGAALQQAIPGFIRNALQNPLNKLASQAGPFGQVINTIGNIAINKLSNYIQSQVGQVFGDVLGGAGGTVGQVLSNAAAGPGMVAINGAAVPVNTVTINQPVQHIDSATHRTADATETSAQERCVASPLVRKIKNALLSLLFRSTIDFFNSGFNGNTGLIQNIAGFLQEGVDAVTQDVIQNQLSGICSPYRQDIQTILLTQYQYETNFGQSSQCSAPDGGAYTDNTDVRDCAFPDSSCALGQAWQSLDQARAARASYLQAQELYIQANGTVRGKITCTSDGSQSPPGDYCPGNSGVDTFRGAWSDALVQNALKLPQDQLLNANDIGALIDSLSASVTQFAFQGINGLMGLSQSSGSQGSYLDAMVGDSGAGAQGAAQNAVGTDIGGAIAIEQNYRDTVDSVLQNLIATRTVYQAAIACYQLKLNQGHPEVSLNISNASSTITTAINPLIASLTTQKNNSQDAIDQLQILQSQAASALTASDIIGVNDGYTALVQGGLVHTSTDVTFLENDLYATAQSLSILAADANAQLAECQAL